MIRKIRRKRLNAPMLEIICTLAILVIVSVCLLKLFLGANSLEKKARDISEASIQAQTIGEMIEGASDMESVVNSLDLTQIQNNYSTAIYEKYYDSDWNAVHSPDAYRATITIDIQNAGTGDLYVADIIIKSEKSYPVIKKEDGNQLTSIEVCSYKPK